MTVAELIAELAKHPLDHEVVAFLTWPAPDEWYTIRDVCAGVDGRPEVEFTFTPVAS